MPLLKQHLLRRLHRPADGEGNDLGGGGSATEAAIDAIGVDPDPVSDTPPEQAAAEAPADQPAGEGAEPAPEKTADPRGKLASMLDEITDQPAGEKKPEGEKPADQAQPEAKPEGEKKPELKTPEQEEAELLEGVKSDRGKERIRQVFAEKKQLEQDIGSFREMVKSTGMSADQFATTLEFGRLVNSGDPKNLEVALGMIEQQRADLYARLGKEAPGVDLLAEHTDLQQAVENMEITRERAVELAKFRRQENQQRQAQQVQQQTLQQRQQFEQTVQQAAGQMEAYLSTRAKEIDHPARMKIISDHFRNPANMQKFVSEFRPEQWPTALQLMYDNIQVPRAQQHAPQPIRSRPAPLGNPAPAGNNPLDRVAQRLDSMGI